MPITPLHLGVLAPINHFFPNKVSNIAFILVTLWIDGNAILYYGFGLDGGEFHSPATHSFLGVMILSTIAAVPGMLNVKWVLGAYLGGLTHVLLDMLVHVEMNPFFPVEGNPFYFAEGMPIVSALLVLPLIWFIVQIWSCSLGWIARKKEEPLL